MATLKAVRGTRDLLPPETELWNRIEATARQVFARYHFGEIRTPIFEDTSLFARSVGEETDIVSKEMYTWEDRDRFDKGRLKEKWLEQDSGLGEYFDRESDVSIGDARVDLVARRWGKREGKKVLVIELIEFKQEIGVYDVDRMVRLMSQYGDSAVSTHVGKYLPRVFQGLFVVPAKRNLTANVEAVALQRSVRIEQLTGDFFLASQRLTLRPENTAGVVRAYIEHKLGESGQLQKLYYIGPQFRRERPQKGRYRQFWQIGAEVIGPPFAGSESPLRDAEVLEMLATLLDELGITGWTLELNSVGSAADPTEFSSSVQPVMPSSSSSVASISSTSASRNGDSLPDDGGPITSAPICQNCR